MRNLALPVILSCSLFACSTVTGSSLLTPFYARNHTSLLEDMKVDLCSDDAAYTLAHFGWTLTNSDMRPYEGIPVHRLPDYDLISTSQFRTLQDQFVRIENQYPEGIEVGGVPAAQVHSILDWCN